MEYSKCTVTVRSVDTTVRPYPTKFTVVSVCELIRPGNDAPFKFTQKFIIKRVPWTTTKFRIIEIHFKFEDVIEDTSKTAEVSDCLGLPDNKNNGMDDKLKESSLKRIDKLIRKVFGKKIGEKSQCK
jgi:hypothetical protein